MTDNSLNISPKERPQSYGLRTQTGLKAGGWQETLGDAGSATAGAAQNAARSVGQTVSNVGSATWNTLPGWATWPW